MVEKDQTVNLKINKKRMGFKPIHCFRGVNKIPGAHIEALMSQRMLQISASYFYIVFSTGALLITTLPFFEQSPMPTLTRSLEVSLVPKANVL